MYKDMMDTIGMVNAADPELGAAMERELTRQRENIELIASENIVSPAVMAAMGSVLTNKYAEGLPGKRYYGGCVYVDEVENIAIRRACQLFGAKYANVQPHSGAQANLAEMCIRDSPSGVDEEKVEDDVQYAGEDADEARGKRITRRAQHGGIGAHGHDEGQGSRPDGKIGRSVCLQCRVCLLYTSG